MVNEMETLEKLIYMIVFNIGTRREIVEMQIRFSYVPYATRSDLLLFSSYNIDFGFCALFPASIIEKLRNILALMLDQTLRV